MNLKRPRNSTFPKATDATEMGPHVPPNTSLGFPGVGMWGWKDHTVFVNVRNGEKILYHAPM